MPGRFKLPQLFLFCSLLLSLVSKAYEVVPYSSPVLSICRANLESKKMESYMSQAVFNWLSGDNRNERILYMIYRFEDSFLRPHELRLSSQGRFSFTQSHDTYADIAPFTITPVQADPQGLRSFLEEHSGTTTLFISFEMIPTELHRLFNAVERIIVPPEESEFEVKQQLRETFFESWLRTANQWKPEDLVGLERLVRRWPATQYDLGDDRLEELLRRIPNLFQSQAEIVQLQNSIDYELSLPPFQGKHSAHRQRLKGAIFRGMVLVGMHDLALAVDVAKQIKVERVWEYEGAYLKALKTRLRFENSN